MRTIKQLLTLATYVTAGTPESSIYKTTCLEEQKNRTLLCESDWVVCHVTLSHFLLKDLITVITGGSFHILALGHIVLHRLVIYNCGFIWDNFWKVLKPKCLWAFNFYMNTNRPLCEDLAVPPRRGTWPIQVWEGHRATGSKSFSYHIYVHITTHTALYWNFLSN